MDRWLSEGSASRISAAEKRKQEMNQGRRNHSAAFKARVGMGALKGEQAVAALAGRYQVHLSQSQAWKKALLEGAARVLKRANGKRQQGVEALIAQLYPQIGQLKVERDLLRSSGCSLNSYHEKMSTCTVGSQTNIHGIHLTTS